LQVMRQTDGIVETLLTRFLHNVGYRPITSLVA
jgi:hypothetical protein